MLQLRFNVRIWRFMSKARHLICLSHNKNNHPYTAFTYCYVIIVSYIIKNEANFFNDFFKAYKTT